MCSQAMLKWKIKSPSLQKQILFMLSYVFFKKLMIDRKLFHFLNPNGTHLLNVTSSLYLSLGILL